GFYTNIVLTEIFGTNITQGSPTQGTNYYITNVVSEQFFQNNDYGQYDYFLFVNVTNYSYTNINGVFTPDPNGPNAYTFSNNVGTNFTFAPFPCNQVIPPTMSTDTPPIITTIFCTNFFTTNIVPSATPGL